MTTVSANTPPQELVDEVLTTVRELVGEVLGEESLDEIEVTMQTSFADDLQLESIEFVALSEQLLERYGDRVDFVSWMGEMELDDIVQLTVGELVSFVASCLT